ncbi:hypothetical protein JG687_00005587 [Phytophthora cactorum]|uniref:Uncharacterized protein n=1 Tax=Phytophthora cactorum TaxID=29920 RepID=A0A8T1ULT4_9STRA|nr:hypothetical protein JG687_00005587 [Phytophthora cactorum]
MSTCIAQLRSVNNQMLNSAVTGLTMWARYCKRRKPTRRIANIEKIADSL